MSTVSRNNITSQTLLRMRDLNDALGLSRSHIYRLMAEGRFPKSVSLVPGGTSVAWVASEIQEWVEQRIAERDAGVQA